MRRMIEKLADIIKSSLKANFGIAKGIANMSGKKELALALLLALNFAPESGTIQKTLAELQQTQDTALITGKYQDKKGNPIPDAKATYNKEGMGDPLPFAVTDQNGNFEIVYTTVGFDNPLSTEFQVGQNFPNPYENNTNIPIQTTGPANVVIFNSTGQAAEQIKIPFEGNWLISGDIYSSGGVLPYTVISHDGQKAAGKMIKTNSSQGGYFNLQQTTAINNIVKLKSSNAITESTEYIEFVKDNTSTNKYDVLVDGDTYLGTIVGNAGPTILGEIPTQNKTPGDTILLNLNQFIYNDDTPIYQSSNPNFVIKSDSLIQYLATEAGAFSTTITTIDSADNTLQKTLDFAVNVSEKANTAPSISKMPNISFNEDEAASNIDLDSIWTDQETLAINAVWSYNGNSNINVNIDPANIISHTATPNWFGSESITITGTDEGGLSDSKTYTVTVNSVYDPITQKAIIPDVAINEGEKQILTEFLLTYVSNPDSNAVSITGIVNDEGIALNYIMNGENLEIETVDENNDQNLTNIIISLHDGTTALNLAGYKINKTAINDEPEFNGNIENYLELNQGDSFDIDISGFEDVDNPLNYELIGAPEGTTIEKIENILRANLPADKFGDYANLKIVATEIGTSELYTALSNEFNISVTKTPDTEAPVISLPDIIEFNEDGLTSYLLDNYVTDNESLAQNITWNFTGKDSVEVSLDALRNADFTSRYVNWNGQDSIIAEATDEEGNKGTKNIVVKVNPVYDAISEKATIANAAINEGEKQTLPDFLNTYVNNPDSLSVSITGITNNEGIPLNYLVNGDNLEIETTDENHDENLTNIIISLNDGTTALNLASYDLGITPINDAPNVNGIPDKSFNEDESDNTTDLDNYFTDEETIAANAIWSFEGNTNIGVSINPTSHIVTYTAVANWSGIENIIFTATDEEGLTASDTAIIEAIAVNDAPVFDDSNYGNQSTPKEKSFKLPLNKFSDIDNLLSELSISLTNLTDATYAVIGDSVEITPNADYIGTMAGVQITATDPGALSDISDVFDIEVTPPAMSTVTFQFKAVSTDENITTGTSEIYWNQTTNPWASDSVRTADANGQLTIQFEQGKEYEISAKATASLEDVWITEYTVFKEGSNHLEQRALEDQSSPLTFNSTTHNVKTYKFLSEKSGDFYWLRAYMSRQQDLGNSNVGTRRVSDAELESATIWWDTENGYVPSATQLGWVQDVIDNYKTCTHVGLDLQYVQGSAEPTGLYFKIHADASHANPSNATVYDDETHNITRGSAFYGLNPTEQDFKIELRQTIGDINDFGGTDPDITENTSPYSMNTTGEFIHSATYLFKPKTKF